MSVIHSLLLCTLSHRPCCSGGHTGEAQHPDRPVHSLLSPRDIIPGDFNPVRRAMLLALATAHPLGSEAAGKDQDYVLGLCLDVVEAIAVFTELTASIGCNFGGVGVDVGRHVAIIVQIFKGSHDDLIISPDFDAIAQLDKSSKSFDNRNARVGISHGCYAQVEVRLRRGVGDDGVEEEGRMSARLGGVFVGYDTARCKVCLNDEVNDEVKGKVELRNDLSGYLCEPIQFQCPPPD
jgi:hypothetical protein